MYSDPIYVTIEIVGFVPILRGEDPFLKSEDKILSDADRTAENTYAENTADTSALPTVPVIPASAVSVKKNKLFYTPVIISAAIVAFTLLFVCFWGIFMNRDIKTTWTLHFHLDQTECAASYTFGADNSVLFHNGGSIRKGEYRIVQDENGKDIISMTFRNFSDFGTPSVTFRLAYRIGGSALTGRSIECTDLDGMIFPPDQLSEENKDAAKQKKNAASFMEENGMRYYIFSMSENKGYQTQMKPFENASADKQLLGIWLEKNEDANYDNTFAFYEDGTITITYRDRIYRGCYTAKDGECTFNIAQVDGSFSDIPIRYRFDDEKLVIAINDVPAVYVRTDNVNAFDNGIR